MLGDLSKYVIVTNDAEGIDGLGQSTLAINSLTVPVFTAGENSYVYGYDETGQASWFKVNADGSYEKSHAPAVKTDTGVESGTEPDQDQINKPKKDYSPSLKTRLSSILSKAKDFFTSLLDNRRNLLIFIDVLAVFLLLVVIFMIKNSHSKDDTNPFPEEDEGDDSFFENNNEEDNSSNADRDHDEEIPANDVKENEIKEDNHDSNENLHEPEKADLDEDSSYEDAEEEEEEEDDDDDEGLGLFARMRREKREEKEWKDLSEMDLKDFSSRIRKKNHPDDADKSSIETESDELKELKKEIHDNSAKKKDINFIDFNKL
jgi:cell division protein FtsN